MIFQELSHAAQGKFSTQFDSIYDPARVFHTFCKLLMLVRWVCNCLFHARDLSYEWAQYEPFSNLKEYIPSPHMSETALSRQVQNPYWMLDIIIALGGHCQAQMIW